MTLVVLGALLTTAFAPFFIWQAAILSLSLLLLMLHHSPTPKGAFWDGWWFGLGHFTTGLYWFAFALLTDAEQFAWLIPFAVLGIPSVLAFYIALVTCLTRKFTQSLAQQWLCFTIFWVIAEFARAYLFSGFPWNLLGYIWGANDISAQSASLFSVWGLSLLSVLFCSSFALLLSPQFTFRKTGLYYVGSCLTIFAFLCVFGIIRLHQATHNTAAKPVYMRLVQGNIAQHHKWNPSLQMDIFKTYLDLSAQPSAHPLSAIIWPESALPFFPQEQLWVRQVIAEVAPESGYVITGALRLERDTELSDGLSIWNSLFTLNDEGEIAAFYDKHHLVPFGEYIPLRSILPFKKITAGSTDFSEGEGPKTLTVDNLPAFSPLICYEVIFADAVTDNEGDTPPAWMLNITNDAWFGISTGPYQHLHMARFRALEEGIPLVRAANTGVSAVIDPYGRIVSQIDLNERAVLDFELPLTSSRASFYKKNHGFLLIFMALLTIFITFRLRKL